MIDLDVFFSRFNQSYWEWNACLDIKIRKRFVSNLTISGIFAHLKLWIALVGENFNQITWGVKDW